MGMGAVRPAFLSTSRTRLLRPHWFQFLTGFGMSLPRTCKHRAAQREQQVALLRVVHFLHTDRRSLRQNLTAPRQVGTVLGFQTLSLQLHTKLYTLCTMQTLATTGAWHSGRKLYFLGTKPYEHSAICDPSQCLHS